MVIGKNLNRWNEEDIDYHYFLLFGSRSNRVVSVSWKANKSQSKPMSSSMAVPALPPLKRKSIFFKFVKSSFCWRSEKSDRGIDTVRNTITGDGCSSKLSLVRVTWRSR